MNKIIKATNWILAGCLSLLGFFCCEKESRVEYGTPLANFNVTGKVVDKATEKPIPGIQVIVPRVDFHLSPTSDKRVYPWRKRHIIRSS